MRTNIFRKNNLTPVFQLGNKEILIVIEFSLSTEYYYQYDRYISLLFGVLNDVPSLSAQKDADGSIQRVVLKKDSPEKPAQHESRAVPRQTSRVRETRKDQILSTLDQLFSLSFLSYFFPLGSGGG